MRSRLVIAGILLPLSVQSSLACRCAPLASCIVYLNESWGCLCPFYGDGYNSCEEQRFVTDVVVRSKEAIEPWLQHIDARVGHMTQRRLLAETQYVLELDSTNYEAMLEMTQDINRKNWSHKVALLGSATSRIVQSHNFEELPPLLEITNISFYARFWIIDFVASDGFFFVATETVPLPCIHTQGVCCSQDYAYVPFLVGAVDLKDVRACRLPMTNTTQALGNLNNTYLVVNQDSTYQLRVAEQDLGRLGDNFSLGIVAADTATQVQISLTSNLVGNFTRQVAPFVMMQIEQFETVFIRCWAQVLLEGATVVFVQYAWEDMDWIMPDCQKKAGCQADQPVCQGTVKNNMLELWVPIHQHLLTKGNLTLYMVVQQGQTLARIMTQSSPSIQVKHCQDVAVSSAVEIQLLQGLTQQQIYRGAVRPVMQLQVEPQTDTLITLVARSTRGVTIDNLRAVHAKSDEERALVAMQMPCPTCVTEQLILAGKVASARSCFLFGTDDPYKWIQNYVGLVGSTLAMDILGKVPTDVRAGTAAGAWINPVWPYKTDETLNTTTYLYAKFTQPPKVAGPVMRRLLEFPKVTPQNGSWGPSWLQWSRANENLKPKWLMIATTAFIVFLWTTYHILYYQS